MSIYFLLVRERFIAVWSLMVMIIGDMISIDRKCSCVCVLLGNASRETAIQWDGIGRVGIEKSQYLYVIGCGPQGSALS